MMKQKPWRTGTWALAAAVLASAIAAPGAAAAAEPEDELYEVFSLIETMHVSGISGEELKDAAIRGMLEELDDPYTEYFSPEEWQALQDAYEQNMVGIGIQFAQTDEGLLILEVFEGSAAKQAGLAPGDAIVRVGEKPVKGTPLEEIYELLLGPEGSTVKLQIADGTSRLLETVTITRKPFHIPSVSSDMMDGGTGYLRIDSFSSDTAGLVREALDAFESNPEYDSLVIDIRGNPGGYLDAVAEVASFFIEDGPILYSVDREGSRKPVEIENGSSVDVPVVLLVDGYSASASEVFAGAMKDYKLATLVGERTYGKGSVQQLVPLESGGGLKVTIQQYLTPRRSPVNGVGIEPNVGAATPLEATLKALRLAGADELKLTFRSYETVANGVSFNETAAWIVEGGKTYLSAKALAAVVDGAAAWDGATQSVKLTGRGGAASFAAKPNGGLLLRDGASYIELGAFAKAFPNAKAKTEGKSVVLEWSDHG